MSWFFLLLSVPSQTTILTDDGPGHQKRAEENWKRAPLLKTWLISFSIPQRRKPQKTLPKKPALSPHILLTGWQASGTRSSEGAEKTSVVPWSMTVLDVTYNGEQLITPSLWQEATHDLRLREGCYRLWARLIGLQEKKHGLVREAWAQAWEWGRQ